MKKIFGFGWIVCHNNPLMVLTLRSSPKRVNVDARIFWRQKAYKTTGQVHSGRLRLIAESLLVSGTRNS